MKHTAIRSLAAGLLSLLLLGSCANGAETELSSPGTSRTAASADAADDSPADGTPAAEAEDEAEETEEAQEDPAPLTDEEALAAAMEYIGRPVDELIAVIGEPEDRDYAPSCMGDGEDGNLYYGGFIVYTYRENGEETVQDVE